MIWRRARGLNASAGVWLVVDGYSGSGGDGDVAVVATPKAFAGNPWQTSLHLFTQFRPDDDDEDDDDGMCVLLCDGIPSTSRHHLL